MVLEIKFYIYNYIKWNWKRIFRNSSEVKLCTVKVINGQLFKLLKFTSLINPILWWTKTESNSIKKVKEKEKCFKTNQDRFPVRDESLVECGDEDVLAVQQFSQVIDLVGLNDLIRHAAEPDLENHFEQIL